MSVSIGYATSREVLMGRRGPPPTPTPILERRGSWRAKERRETATPVRTTRVLEAPERPAWLRGAAGRLWDQLSPILSGLGVLTLADERILARYCLMSTRWLRLEAFLRRRGHVYRTVSREGEVVWRAYPHASTAKLLAGDLLRLERELGLTPAARVALRLEEPDLGAESEDDDSSILRVG